MGATPWKGMEGTGEIVYAQDKTYYPATLSMIGADRFRLDAQTDKGMASTRINGLVGKTQDATGKETAMSHNAAAAGLFPFQLVRTAHFPGKQTSLIDHGMTSVDGKQLHRMTVENQTIGRNPVTKSPQTIAMDLYFDPSTHLLIKSVSNELLTSGHSASFLRVVTYSDYRLVEGALIPFHYAESMDGELYWTLQLTAVQLNPTFDAKYFQF